MKKWQRKLRRMMLSRAWKHLDNCHPKFKMVRSEKGHRVLWDESELGLVRTATSLRVSDDSNVFIVAAGPSLQKIDLKRIPPHHSISLNGSIKKFLHDDILPTHCIIADHRVFDVCWDFIELSIKSGANCFFPFTGISHICERDPGLIEQHDNIYLIESVDKHYDKPRMTAEEFYNAYRDHKDIYLSPQHNRARGTIGFSTNAELGFFSSKTVAVWATQLAVALGYRYTHLIGMDLGGTGKAYFDEKYSHNTVPDFLPVYDPYIKVCFELARQAAEERGIKIYNLSARSTLPDEIIEKIDFDTVLSRYA
jgi:KDO transferase-3